MTIITTPARATALAASGETNNPFFTGAPCACTPTTGDGTEVLPAANAYSGTTFDPWVATPDGSDVATWELDFGEDRTPTFIGIAAHNAATVGAQIRIQSSDTGVGGWIAVDDATWTPSDNQAIGWRISGVTNRYWRLRFSQLTGDISVGVIWLGNEIIMPQRIYQGYAPPITPTEVDLNTNVSEGANLLGSAYTERGSTFQASFSHIDPTFLRGATWTAFQNRWNRGNGAFWGWRPTKYGDLFYAWRSGGIIQPTNEGPKDLMGFTVQGRAYDEP